MAHVIRCYDTFGRLLYIAGTVSLPAPRIKTLRKEPWWPLVDQGKLLVEKVSGVNLPQRLSTAIVRGAAEILPGHDRLAPIPPRSASVVGLRTASAVEEDADPPSPERRG